MLYQLKPFAVVLQKAGLASGLSDFVDLKSRRHDQTVSYPPYVH